MSRVIFALATIVIAICFGVGDAAALTASQEKAVKSPQVAKANACLSDLATSGKGAHIETDRDGGRILLLDPKEKAKLGQLMGTMFSCLDAAFDMKKKKVERFPDKPLKGSRSWVWYTLIEDNYVWCASDGDSTPEAVGNLAGSGSKKNWYAIAFQCSVDTSVLGWYKP